MIRHWNHLVLACVIGGFGGVLHAQAPEPPRPSATTPREAGPKSAGRRWADGLLKVEEFRAKPDLKASGAASTLAHIRYQFRWSSRFDTTSATVRLEEVDVYAEFRPYESWMKGAAGRKMLDHEQGHFDIMEIFARKTRIDMEKLKPRLAIRDKDETTARDRVKARLDKVLAKYLAECEDSQVDYDYQTRHGLDRTAQSLHRRKQKEQLEELPPAKPATPRSAPR